MMCVFNFCIQCVSSSSPSLLITIVVIGSLVAVILLHIPWISENAIESKWVAVSAELMAAATAKINERTHIEGKFGNWRETHQPKTKPQENNIYLQTNKHSNPLLNRSVLNCLWNGCCCCCHCEFILFIAVGFFFHFCHYAFYNQHFGN